MPLEVIRVMQSTLFAKSSGDEFKAAFALWCASWMEVPAASLPDDDEMLEFFSRSKNWKKVKEKALHGWIRCSDGRLYHAVVAKNALEAWDRRLDYQESSNNKTERQKRWRERCKQLSDQLREIGINPPRGASLETLEQMLRDGQASTQASTPPSTVDDVEIGKTGTVTGTETVKGQGQVLKTTVPNGTGAGAPQAIKTPAEMTKQELWSAGKSLLKQSGMPEAQCGSFVGKLVKDYGDALVVEAVRTAVVEQPADPASFLKATCKAKAGNTKGMSLTDQQQASTEEARRLLFGNQGEVIDAPA